MSPLNGPWEMGLRLVFFLESAFPRGFDINQLVLADHLLTHSADMNGPASLHPSVAIREGEFGMKRATIQSAISRIASVDLIRVSAGEEGILYAASDRAYGFVRLFASQYSVDLRSIAAWAVKEFDNESVRDSETRMKSVTRDWSKTLSPLTAPDMEHI